MKLGIFFIFSLIASQAKAASHLSEINQLFPTYQIILKNDKIQVYTNDSHDQTISILKFAELKWDQKIPDKAVLAERVKSYAFFDLKDQIKIQDFNGAHFQGLITESTWLESKSYELEVWFQKGRDTISVVSSYDNLRVAIADKAKITALVNQMLNSRRPASDPTTEAQGECAVCNITLFEAPVREAFKSVQGALSAECTKGKDVHYTGPEVAYKVVEGCLKSGAEMLVGIARLAYEAANLIVKTQLNPFFDMKVEANMAHVISQIVRDPSAFLTKIYGLVVDTIHKEVDNIKYCGIEYQSKIACDVVLTLLTSGGLIKAAKEFLAVGKAVEAATTAEKVVETAKTSSKVAKAIDESVKASPPIAEAKAASELAPKTKPVTQIKASEASIEIKYGNENQEVSKVVRQQVADSKEITTSDIEIADLKQTKDNERKVYEKIKKMYELKKEPTTEALVDEIDKLNMEALETTGRELKRRGIAYKIVDPRQGGTYNDLTYNAKKVTGFIKELSSTEKIKIKIDSFIRFKVSAEERLKIAVSDDEKQKLKKLINDYDQKISEHKKRLSDPPTGQPIATNSMAQIRHAWTSPYIILEKGPTNPKLLNQIIEKSGAEIVISPNYKSLFPKTLGGVAGDKNPVFVYPIEQIFSESPILGGITLHEVRHLALAKLRAAGKETPYDIKVTAAARQKLHTVRNGFYDTYMHFEEMSTWNRDLNFSFSKVLGSKQRTVFDFEKGIMRDEPGVFHQVRVARGLEIITNTAKETISAARTYLEKGSVGVMKVKIKGVNNAELSSITLPYIKDGKNLGDIEITLSELTEANKDQVIIIARKYLDRVEAQTLRHAENAKKVLDANPGVDPTHGVIIDSN